MMRKRPRRARRLRRIQPTRRPLRRSIPRSIRPTVYRFKRFKQFDDITAAATPVAGALSFALNDVANSGEFTSLFDAYKLLKVVVTFAPRDITIVTSPYHLYTPYFYTYIDHDDATAPASLSEVEQVQSMRKTLCTRRHTRVLVPSCLSMVYKSALASGYAPTRRPVWIDCVDATVPHYGLKFYMDSTPSPNANFIYTPMVTYYFAFKDVR